jgi:predicted ATP-dependent serine protease
MDLNYDNTQFKAVKEITIPDLFYRRYKTGITVVDELFGDGILPGSAITMTAPAGCGKTTLLLQILEGLTMNGYETAYASGEENTYQLAFTCNRLKVKNVKVGNETDIDTLAEQMKHFDVMVVDSFQALTTKKKLNSRALEKYAVSKLTRAAKDTECTIFFIMHLTKDGKLKGGTIVPHTVDVNMEIGIEGEIADSARKISFAKNRFGALNEVTLFLDAKGYDFGNPVKVEETETKAPSKKNRKKQELAKIMTVEGSTTAQEVMKLLNVEYNRAYNLLRELVMNGKMEKEGKGQSATYAKPSGSVNGLLNAADSMKLFLKVAGE